MIEITTVAQEKLLELWAEKKHNNLGLLIAISGRTANDFKYLVRFIAKDEGLDDYEPVMQLDDLSIFIDAGSLYNLKGATIDFTLTGCAKLHNEPTVWCEFLNAVFCIVI